MVSPDFDFRRMTSVSSSILWLVNVGLCILAVAAWFMFDLNGWLPCLGELCSRVAWAAVVVSGVIVDTWVLVSDPKRRAGAVGILCIYLIMFLPTLTD